RHRFFGVLDLFYPLPLFGVAVVVVYFITLENFVLAFLPFAIVWCHRCGGGIYA
ncbi:3773_t:CDS:2, partial [Gigaspora rosea]